MKGRYDDALAIMEKVELELLRTLKYQQYWTMYMGLLKMQHALHQ